MANLNFQQPPRSIASASLSGRSTGFGGTSLSGHVTPTSGMFPQGWSGILQKQNNFHKKNGKSNKTPFLSDNIFIGNSSFGQAPQPPQLSPNRNVQMSGSVGVGNIGVGNIGGGQSGGNNVGPPQRANIFGQRAFADRRPMSGIGGPITNMGSFIQSRGYGSQSGNLSNLHAVFGGGPGDNTGTPPLLDLSEFPSLGNVRGQNDAMPQSNPLQTPGSKPYGILRDFKRF